MTRIKLFLLSIFFAGNVFAANKQCAVNGECSFRISQLSLDSEVYVLPDQITWSGMSCVVDPKGLVLASDHVFFDEIYSMLLSAKLSDVHVTVNVGPVTGVPQLTPPCKILAAKLYKL